MKIFKENRRIVIDLEGETLGELDLNAPSVKVVNAVFERPMANQLSNTNVDNSMIANCFFPNPPQPINKP